jgi:serine/threonine protein phosphatase PrpC
MASRLQLKYGLVSEQERLSNSADALLVSEPTTGSKLRTKGSLYLIVTARAQGGRTREACQLVADTIRREYYYDESAGIAICLEKAIRSASRRLRHSREGSGLELGSLGVAAAVVRGGEMYVATTGDAEAYLVRAARLLMPEHEPGEGLPAADSLRVDVWRGDFSVGDSLVLCSRNMTDVVGTEELKNAVVTLHPQSAVEHLHHLFVAAGGEGSDAVLAIEATEVSLSRVEHRLVPVSPSEPLAGAPLRSPIPLADQFAGAASAVQDRAEAARSAVHETFSRAVSSVLDLMPRRRTSYRRIAPAASRRETQRRAATALLSFIGVVAVLGVVMWWWGGPGRAQENPVQRVTAGEAAFRSAQQRAGQVFGPANLLVNDRNAAQRELRLAWADLDRAAQADIEPAPLEQLRREIAAGLDRLYGTHAVASEQLYAAPEGAEISGLVRGPDEAYYVIADRSVIRVDPETGASVSVAAAGEGPGAGMGTPSILARGGLDLVIVDIRGSLWRWRPSDESGAGTLGPMRVSGEQQWGPDVVDVATFLIDAEQSQYRLYVPHPTSNQILRYEPVADGSGFRAPTPYFVSEGEDVAAFRQLHIDGDIYAVTSDALLRYFNGRRTTFELETPPDSVDLRPGSDLGRMAATGTRGVGLLLLWDAQHERVIVYQKADGTYVEQYVGAAGSPPFANVRGMLAIDRGETEPTLLVWANAQGLHTTVLVAPDDPGQEPTPGPGASPLPGLSPQPGISPPPRATPAGPTIEPTERPRRTPRGSPQP